MNTTTEDHKRKEVQRTRPRVCMLPAIALDDIEDPVRQVLIDDTYTTSTTEALQEGLPKTLASSENKKAPLSEVYAPVNITRLPRLLKVPYVSPEWRMDSVKWDSRQLRSHVDPTKNFWLARRST